MTGGEEQNDGPPSAANAADSRAMARDWITIWQSEFSAMATDREAQEQLIRLVSLWAGGAQLALDWLPDLTPRREARDSAAGCAGSGAAPGAAPAAAAPDARDAALERLARRVEELERLVAKLERPEPGA